MTAASQGTIGVHITAGKLHPIDSQPSDYIGQGFYMGDAHDLTIHFKPAIARQWIQTLTELTTEKDN